MILCCKTCGNCVKTENVNTNCDYCRNQMEVLMGDEELAQINESELPAIITALSEKYKTDNAEYNADLWKSRSERDRVQQVNRYRADLSRRIGNHMVTTGYNFEGYKIKSYLDVISAEVVLGTGFLSEFSASFADFFGTKATMFENKLESAKKAAMDKLVKKSSILGGNAVIGIDLDYTMFSNNIICVIASGTCVIIEEE